jgi:Na+-driven multidrug efflux pump
MGVLRFSLMLAFCMSLVMTVICYFGANPLVSAFVEEAEAHAFGMAFASIYIYSGPILGIMFVFVTVFICYSAYQTSFLI